jgi:23S rRNA (cytosine1962-C5)-methyltransferase
MPADHIALLKTLPFDGYALLDSGAGRKLERFGEIVVDRPEPQALWQPARPPAQWSKAHAAFKATRDGDDDSEHGRWQSARAVPETWPMRVADVTMLARLSNFRHLGLFPEQMPHWMWMRDQIARVRGGRARVLNLFAYTGAASLIAARADAEVTHVDASKKAVTWAKHNQDASKLGDAPIRWIVEDARKFVAREVRRGRTYHVILIDPPKFGRGPEGEIWDFFTHVAPLLADCAKLRVPAPAPSAIVLTSYAVRASCLAIDGLMRSLLVDRAGEIESGELALVEEDTGRLLPTSQFSRWAAS